MRSMKSRHSISAWTVTCIAILGMANGLNAQNPCDVPDNGTGTVTLPPAGCEYLSPAEVHEIIDGLPPGTTIEFAPIHKEFICTEQARFGGCPPPGVCEDTGGSLGGQVDCFDSILEMQLQGTGDLAGFNRNIIIPIASQVHTAPRNPGDPIQTFPTDFFFLQGELFGDPDFQQLTITGGTGFGLPSPGQTTLRDLGNGDFAVDSFFDITYQIDFQGAPGSALEGMAGSTSATIRMSTGDGTASGGDCVGVGEDCFETVCDGNTFVDLSSDPIPAGFFDPGSLPFEGIIEFGGGPSPIDTIVQRLDKMCFQPPPSTVQIPIEMKFLDLVSCQPITVGNSGDWDVAVGLSGPQPNGQMVVTKLDPDGGVFDATIPLQLVYVFSRVGNPGDTRILDMAAMGLPPVLLQSVGTPWTHDETLDQCTPDGFFAGGKSNDGIVCCEETCHSSGGSAPHEHCTTPPGCVDCPEVCAPATDGFSCEPITCPDPNQECLPRCVRTDPLTGAVTLLDCDCRQLNECQVIFDPVGVPVGSGGATAEAQSTPNPCVVADNGTGTVTLPPAGCEYLSPDEVHQIIDGLPAGTTLDLAPIHKDFICEQNPTGTSFPGCPPPGVCETGGGSLGGQTDCFVSNLELQINGTGALGGYNRTLTVPVQCQVETAPRNPGDPVQTFDTQMNRLQGELFGDPDFCTLRVTGGTAFGLPSPGSTTLTELPGGNFNVDSFFDITYQIEFQGCPGSPLEGMAGTTTATVRMSTGSVGGCTGDCPAGTVCVETKTVNADGSIDTCCDCVPEGETEACCFSDGSPCADLDPATCVANGGVPQGPGTDCLNTDCPGGPCEPLPDGSGCSQADCPTGMECVPVCAEVDLASGDVFVTACDCKPIDDCHLELDPTAADGTSSGGTSAVAQAGSGNPCDVPDNGSGTVTLPPAGCSYLSPDEVHEIIDGLPPGTTIELEPIHTNFICQEGGNFPGCPPPGLCEEPGGGLGGEVDCFSSQLQLNVAGTGSLAGFNRSINVPVQCQAETAPRTPGDAEQTFATRMNYLQGELFGDPDFCTLRITGGDALGLPSPGQTTLTQLPGGNFAVDSFFDITYQIEFQGCPGSVLDGMAGTTTATIRMATGTGLPKCVGTCPNGTVCEEVIDPIGTDQVAICCDCADCVPEITAAVSRAYHGNNPAVRYDIDLLGPTTATEMRRCDKQIVVTFNAPIEPCDGTLDFEAVSNVGNITNLSINGNELTIDLDNVPDPSCLTISLRGLCCVGSTTPMTPDEVSVIILGGDANLSGGVTVIDLSVIKTHVGENTNATNFFTDMNCSGGITVSDLSEAKAKIGDTAPPCP